MATTTRRTAKRIDYDGMLAIATQRAATTGQAQQLYANYNGFQVVPATQRVAQNRLVIAPDGTTAEYDYRDRIVNQNEA